MRYSHVCMIMALLCAAAHGFRPAFLTELFLWLACVLFVKENPYG